MASHLCGFGHVVGGCHLLRGLEPSGATSKALRVASDSYSGNRFANIGSSALRWAAGCRLIGIIMEGVREAVPLQSLDFNLEGLEEEKANEGLHVVPTWPQELGSWLASLADSLSVQSISTVATGAWKTVMSCLLSEHCRFKGSPSSGEVPSDELRKALEAPRAARRSHTLQLSALLPRDLSP